MPAGHPHPQGLYDGAHEHDACGVAFVADPVRAAEPPDRRPGADRPAQPGPPRRLRQRARHRRRRRHPRPDPRRVPARDRRPSSCRTAVPTRSAARSSPTTTPVRRPPAQPSSGSPPRRAWPSSAGATCRWRRRCSAAPPAGSCRGSDSSSSPRPAAAGRHGAGAAGVLPAQARRARGRGLLLVPVGADPGLQGDAHAPASSSRSSLTCPTAGSSASWRSCTRGSRRTRSRPGRWPIPTA